MCSLFIAEGQGLFQVLPRSHTSCTGPGFVNPNGPARSHTSCTDPGFVNPNGPALDIQEVKFLTFIQHYNTRSSSPSPRKHNTVSGLTPD